MSTIRLFFVCMISHLRVSDIWDHMDCSPPGCSVHGILQQEYCSRLPFQFSSVQSLSRVQLFATPWIAACQVSLSITNSQSSFSLTSIESVMPSSHLILCHPILLLPPIPPSIRVFSNESTLHMRWPKYWSFSFSIIPSNDIPGVIFRMDLLDLFEVQGTLKSLLQHHSSKASILQHSAFFTVQLSHPYMTTGKTIALTRLTFVGKVMSLLLNMLSATAAKSLQSCPTLCDPIDGSPTGSAIPGILQARTLEWVAISFSSAWKWKVKVKSFSHVWLFSTLWTEAYQAPPSMGFSRQEYWSGLPLPSPICYLGWS